MSPYPPSEPTEPTEPTEPKVPLRNANPLGLASILCAVAVFFAVDVVRLGLPGRGSSAVAVYGYVLLSASLLAGLGGVCVVVAATTARFMARLTGKRAVMGWSLVASVALVPALSFARLLTAGRSISASRWRLPLQVGVTAAVAAAVVLLVVVLGRMPELEPRRRKAVAVLAFAVSGLAIGITTFHPTTYLRIHQGFLLAGSIVLSVGFASSVAPRTFEKGSQVGTLLPMFGLVALLGLSYPLTLLGGAARSQAGLVVFSRTIVAQKLSPLLFWLSPVYRSARTHANRKEFENTRLSSSNAPVVPPRQPGSYRGYNVVWISADAFRADALGSRYLGESATPNLDALASRALVFDQAIADYSHTSQSLLSVLSGAWNVTGSLKKTSAGASADADRNRLARLMRQSGYYTLANMMGGRSSDEHFRPTQIPGFDQHVQPGPTCIQQVEELERFLNGFAQRQPLFLWMHVYDSHKPLQFPGEVTTGHVENDYYAAIHHVDRCIGRALNALRAHGLWDKTLFVFFADHGESLGEHDRLERHSTCYLHDNHIPLLFHATNLTATRHSAYRIQLSDLLPTVANLIGLDVTNEPFEGDDLSGLFDRPTPTRGIAFSRGHPSQYHCASVFSESWHLIYTKDGQFYELYDVDRDPAETANLVASQAGVVDQLQPLLDAFFDQYLARSNGSRESTER